MFRWVRLLHPIPGWQAGEILTRGICHKGTGVGHCGPFLSLFCYCGGDHVNLRQAHFMGLGFQKVNIPYKQHPQTGPEDLTGSKELAGELSLKKKS